MKLKIEVNDKFYTIIDSKTVLVERKDGRKFITWLEQAPKQVKEHLDKIIKEMVV